MATKSYTTLGASDSLWYADAIGVGSNDDLPMSKWGAAMAYRLVPAVRNSIDIRAQSVAALQWQIIRNVGPDEEDDEILCDSTEAIPSDPLGEAIVRSRRYTKQSLFQSITMDRDMYGETFVELIGNSYGYVRGLRQLNALGMEFLDVYGEITQFRYSSPSTGQYVTFDPASIAYDHTRDPIDDLRGIGLLETAISDVNVSRNLRRFLGAFFRNNAIPGLVITPPKDMQVLTEKNVREIETQIRRFTRGVYNQFKTLTMPIAMDFTQLDMPDIASYDPVISSIDNEIYDLFRIPPGMRGRTGATTYKEGEDARINFYLGTIIPIASEIEEFINYDILPRFHDPKTVRFRFDLSEYDLTSDDDDARSTIAVRDYQGGIATLNEARYIRGYDPIPDGDIFYTSGIVPPADDAVGQVIPLVDGVQDAPVPPSDSSQTEMIEYTPIPAASPSEVSDKSIRTQCGCSPTVEERQPSTYDGMRAEVKAWQRFASNRIGKANPRPFEPTHLRGDLGDWIQAQLNGPIDRLDVENIFDEVLLKIERAEKAIQATRIDFEDAFEDIMNEALSGNIDRRRWSLLLRSTIRRYSNAAFRDGLADGGVSAEPNEAEQEIIAEHIAAQSAYVTNLGQHLFKDEKVTREMADQKPQMWWNKSIKPMYTAGFASAAANQMMEFGGEDGQESCPDCVRLKGQRHRMKDWVRKQLVPGQDTDNFQCGGWQCEHRLIPVSGRARGTW